MNFERPKVGIVILNYNTYDLTKNVIKNIIDVITYPNYEIYVVDNASLNESHKILSEQCKDGSFTYYSSKNNGGYSKGNNIGIRMAVDGGCEYVVIINNDIFWGDPRTLDLLMKCLIENEFIGVVSPNLISLEGEVDPPIYFKKPSFFDLTFGCLLFHKKRMLLKNQDSYQIYAPRGSCMMMRTADLVKINYLDENTFLYFEEPILAERLSKIGKYSYLLGSLKVVHNHSKTISSNISLKRNLKCILDSYTYYLKEYRHYNAIKRYICIVFRKIIFNIHRRM